MWEELKADVRRYPGLRYALESPGFWAVAGYRFGHAAYALPKPLGFLAKLLYRPLALPLALVTGIELPPDAEIGAGLYIGHWGGIVVASHVRIGERCNLSQGVTIGVDGKGGLPQIGDRVYIGPGAKIFGGVKVGSDSAIGANAVVNDDVPAGVSVAGVPAKVVSQKGSRDLIELKPQRRAEAPGTTQPPLSSAG